MRRRLAALALCCSCLATTSGSAQEIRTLPGSVMLMGGTHQDLSSDLRRVFFELAGGKKARIVVIPTAVAHADEPGAAEEFSKPWQEFGPFSVAVLHTRDRTQADDPAFVKPLASATAVFFTNGHRDRIFNAYRGTLVEKELKKLLGRGGLIGGTGTGAAVLGEVLSDRASEGRRTETGLGLVPGFMIEDHNDIERFDHSMSLNPGMVGLMIQNRAAVVIGGKSLRALGAGKVTVHLAKGAGKEAQTSTLKTGEQLDVNEQRRAAASRAEGRKK